MKVKLKGKFCVLKIQHFYVLFSIKLKRGLTFIIYTLKNKTGKRKWREKKLKWKWKSVRKRNVKKIWNLN